jgi:uncharacterized protein (DUF4415 family)
VLKTKEPVILTLDAYVLAALRANGEGWQTRINEPLPRFGWRGVSETKAQD